MRVNEVDLAFIAQPPEPLQPAESAGAVKTVHRKTEGLELLDQSVLPREEVRSLVLEAIAVEERSGRQDELLGATAAEPLDQEQDPLAPGWRIRLGPPAGTIDPLAVHNGLLFAS